MLNSEPQGFSNLTSTPENSSASRLARALTQFAPRTHFFERRFVKQDGFVSQNFLDFETLRHWPELWDTQMFLPAHDGQGEVYFSVATRIKRAGTADAVGVGLAAWADMDDEDVQHNFPIAPSSVVQTSPPRRKYHAYWFLDEPTSNLDILLRINRAIPNADLNAVDKARVLRAPGFANMKYVSRPTARLLRLEADLRYSIDELAKAFPPVVAKPQKYERAHNGTAPNWLGLVFDAIVDSLEREGFRPRSRGVDGAVMALCPLHTDTNRSLSLHPSRGYYCFGCQLGGRLTDLAHRLGVRVAA